MNQIVTITFSPCIDVSTSVPLLAPDIKMNCSPPKLEPGGGGINVARAIHKLGGKATAMYISGGYSGKKFDQMLTDENIPTMIIPGSQETRENIIVVDESNNQQYRFGMPLQSLTETEWQQFLINLEQIEYLQYIIISGSVPPDFPLTMFSKISEIAKAKKAKLIVDTKGDALKSALDAGLFLIKPNLGELSSLVGKKRLDENEIKEEAQNLIRKYNCQVVVVSMGADGAMLVTSDYAKQIKPPQVKRRSTVGAGDSMVAGIVFSLYHGNSLPDALKYGVACGTAATLNSGTELCKKEDVEKLKLQVEIIELD